MFAGWLLRACASMRSTCCTLCAGGAACIIPRRSREPTSANRPCSITSFSSQLRSRVLLPPLLMNAWPMLLERHLKQRYGELFAAQFDVLLYDLTSSYVEEAAENNPM